MKTVLFILTAVLLAAFPQASLAETGKKAPIGEPEISNAKIRIDFEKRIMDVSFQYSQFAGNIKRSKMTVVIEMLRSIGAAEYLLIELKPIRSEESAIEDEITPEIITQGRMMFSTTLPEYVEVDDPREITGIGIVIIDLKGRSAVMFSPVNEIQTKVGI